MLIKVNESQAGRLSPNSKAIQEAQAGGLKVQGQSGLQRVPGQPTQAGEILPHDKGWEGKGLEKVSVRVAI